ncbi:hypothetical protein F7888_03605 [Bacillus sp. PS06]|nr:hypothetical protein [Bacillus sp. PS06]
MRLYFFSIWTVLDPLYYFFTRLTYIHTDDDHQPIFRIRLTRYRGFPLELSDGTIIHKNDLMIKIHLHNVRLLKDIVKIDGETRKARVIYKKVLEGLPYLADYLSKHPREKEIKGIVGITTLNKGCERLGFETFSLRNKWYALMKRLVFIPMYLLSVNQLTKNTLNRPPKYLIMTKEALITRYTKE